MKLTRKQELVLINYGLDRLLDELIVEVAPRNPKTQRKVTTTKKRKWSKAQHEKFAKTMRAVWKRKRAAQNG
jgi:hypothetical protein